MDKKQVVIVTWDDAHGSAHREVTEDDLPHRPIIMQTIGWLLKNDETGVSIANEYAADADSTCFRGHTFIPAKMVRSLTPFNLSTPRKPRNAKNIPLPDDAADLSGPDR